MNRNAWITVVIVAIVFGGGGFYAGVKYNEENAGTKTSAPSGAYAGRTGGAGRFAGAGGAAAGGGFTTGTILTVGSGTMTIQLPNSTSTTAAIGTKIVLFDDATQVTALENVSPSSLQAGQAVTITGATNSDGSITATSIMARSAGASGGQRGAATTGSGQ